MKEMDPKNQKYSSEFLASQSLKKMIPQLLLSVSLFSFVFSYSSLYSSSSSLVYSPKFQYISANYFQPLSHALNKNCVFLICNGLLVFLAKTSGFVRPPSGHDLNDMLQKRIGDSLEKYHVLEESAAEPKEEEEEEEEKGKSTTDQKTKEVSIFIAESEEEGGDCELEDVKKDENQLDESRSCWLFDDDDDDDEQQLYGQEVVEEEQEEDEEEEEKEQKEEMSTEELNKKFEDFIRRMKEEIIINEARQKVVMVK